MARLRMIRGAVEEIFDLRGTVVSMGRSSENTILVEDKQSSRKHCQVEKTEEGDWKLVDLESRNGTKVNGAVVNQHLLKDGDRIEIGDV
ncbi:MAG: FHA domain-containing protein, partial [Planctomycetes bacterium]|nr:FHA domain-containing protein [Planctomycetota bacterium]